MKEIKIRGEYALLIVAKYGSDPTYEFRVEEDCAAGLKKEHVLDLIKQLEKMLKS